MRKKPSRATIFFPSKIILRFRYIEIYTLRTYVISYGLLYTRSGHHYNSVARPEYIQYIQQGNTTKCCPLYSIPYDIINISLRSWLTLQNTALGPTFRPSASTPTLGLHFVMLAAFGG